MEDGVPREWRGAAGAGDPDASADGRAAPGAERLGTTINTVRYWRRRWIGLQQVALAKLSVEAQMVDAPRSGAPARITADQVCWIVELTCEAPAQSARPITSGPGGEVAAEVMKRGIVERISPRHAARIRKIRVPSNSIASATG